MRNELSGEGWTGSFPPEREAPLIYVICDADSAKTLARALETAPFGVIALTDTDWNRDLSPWPAEKVFSQGEDFTGGAQAYLDRLIRRIPEIEGERKPLWRGIAGYSLAGLFAVWALFVCDAFDRAASASGSMWFDGFMDFAGARLPKARVQKVCFSLGDKEYKARNPRMAKVAEATDRIVKRFEALSVPTCFRSETGNHFNEPDQRMVRILRALGTD